MKKTLKWSLMMVLSIIGLATFTSCDEDDNKDVEIPTVEVVEGKYSGTMTYAMAKATANPTATTLDLKVENDSIVFEEFPVAALIKTIITDETMANGIIALVGKLRYSVAYDAALNTANDAVALTMEPKPLVISLGAMGAVSVTITAADKGAYSVKDKTLKFNLTATKAELGGENALPGAIVLSFDMAKK